MPDLVPSVAIGLDRFSPGDIIDFRGSIDNFGGLLAGPSVLRLVLDGVALEDIAVGEVPPGSWLAWTSLPWTATLGAHLLEVVADAEGAVEEEDETNNIDSILFTVEFRPDIVLAALEVVPADPVPGEEVVFRATIGNIGLAAAAQVGFRFHLDTFSQPYDEGLAGPLQPGASIVVESRPWIAWNGFLDVASFLFVANHTVYASARVANGTEESNWENNEEQRTFKVATGLLGASVGGDAEGGVALSVPGQATGGLAASALGDAHGALAAATIGGSARSQLLSASVLGDAAGSAALSAAGDATATCVSPSPSLPCLAVAPLGHAVAGGPSSSPLFPGPGGLALSVLGDADGNTPVSVLGHCNGKACFAITPSGPAEGHYAGISAGGAATGRYLAGSVSAPASSQGGLAVAVLGDASGSSAVSIGGDAHARGIGPAIAVLGHADSNGGPAFGFDPDDGLPPDVGAECDGVPCVDVNPTGDAHGRFAGVSGTGASSGLVALSVWGPSSGRYAAASLFGPSTVTENSIACLAISLAGPSERCTAVSVLGSAEGDRALSLTGPARGAAAVSAFGEAEGDLAASLAGAATGCQSTKVNCVGISALGPASGHLAASGTEDARGTCGAAGSAIPCIAASGAGDAACDQAGGSLGCFAVSVDGDASCYPGTAPLASCAAVSGTGDARGSTLALALGGDASSCSGPAEAPCRGPAVSLLGDAEGTAAASLAGDASTCRTWAPPGPEPPLLRCTGPAVSVLGDSEGSLAVSGFGDATCLAPGGVGSCAGVSGTGDARGAVAVSLTGEAHGSALAVSGCDLTGVCAP